jgi:predicted Zn-dependent peptidase
MVQKIKLFSQADLYYIHQSHFSVHDFGAVHRFPFIQDKITPLAMMRRMMKNVNALYNTKEDMQSFRQSQYALEWYVNTNLESKQLVTTFSATAIRGDLVNNPLLDEHLIQHVLNSIHQPWFTHPDFLLKDKVFDEEKTFNLHRLEQIKVEIGEQIFYELKSMIPSDSPYIQELRGIQNEIQAYTKDKLTDFYQDWIQYPMNFYYVGPLPKEKVVSILNAYPYLKTPTKTISLEHTPISHDTFMTKTAQGTQSQSHYRKIYTTQIPRLTRDTYAIRLLNQMLGEGSESFLFQEIREKLQFCYQVSSSYSLNEGTITIRLGLHKQNIAKTVSLIENQLQNFREGKFERSFFQLHQQQMIDSIHRMKDGVDYKLNLLFNTLVLDLPYDEDRALRGYQSITFEDIVRVASMIQPYRELIYLGVES